MFATCDRRMALGFLQQAYPTCVIEDSADSAGPLLDLVEADVIRVQDPNFHQPTEIVPAKNWDASRHDERVAVCAEFHRRALASPKAVTP